MIKGLKIQTIHGYENYYISTDGDIFRNYKNGKCRKLKPSTSPDGYLRLSLSENNIKKSMSVARLTAITFIANPKNLETVNHKDGNKKNNSVNNLEWMSKRDNTIHALKNGLHPNRMIPVDIYSKAFLVAQCESLHEAERLTGIDHSTIGRAVNKNRYVNGLYMFTNRESAVIPPEAK